MPLTCRALHFKRQKDWKQGKPHIELDRWDRCRQGKGKAGGSKIYSFNLRGTVACVTERELTAQEHTDIYSNSRGQEDQQQGLRTMCEFTLLLLLPSRFSGFDALLKGTFTSVGCLVAIQEVRGELLAVTVMGVVVCFKMHLLYAVLLYFFLLYRSGNICSTLVFLGSGDRCLILSIFLLKTAALGMLTLLDSALYLDVLCCIFLPE